MKIKPALSLALKALVCLAVISFQSSCSKKAEPPPEPAVFQDYFIGSWKSLNNTHGQIKISKEGEQYFAEGVTPSGDAFPKAQANYPKGWQYLLISVNGNKLTADYNKKTDRVLFMEDFFGRE